MINVNRLTDRLTKASFALLYQDKCNMNMRFTRCITNGPGYALIEIAFAGRRMEAAHARVGFSITAWTETHCGRVSRGLLELANDSLRGSTVLHNQDDALKWELECARIAPRAAIELAETEGPRLASSCAACIQFATASLARVDPSQTPAEAVKQITKAYGRSVLEAGKQLISKVIWVVSVPRSPIEYCLSAMLFVIQTQAEGMPLPTGISDIPSERNDVRDRVEFIADRIFQTLPRAPNEPTLAERYWTDADIEL